MDKITITFAKLAGLQKIIRDRITGRGRYFPISTTAVYFEKYTDLSKELKKCLPEMFGDINEHAHIATGGEGDDEGYVELEKLQALLRDIDYIFEVRANSRIGERETNEEKKDCIFITHGRSNEWYKVQNHIEKVLGRKTIELAQQPNQGRTVLQKLNDESDKCFAAIIVMTGDDIISDGEVRARENVMHEIGFFQGKLGLSNVILLHEEGVNLPSNVHGLVYIPFPKSTVEATLGAIQRELQVIAG